MSPSNKNNDDFKLGVGESPVAPGKHSLRPPMKGKRQPRLPKPKVRMVYIKMCASICLFPIRPNSTSMPALIPWMDWI